VLLGPPGAGKSALAKALAGREWSEPLMGDLAAAGLIPLPGEPTPRTLLVREVAASAASPPDAATLAAADVAAFAFDAGDARSLEAALALLEAVASAPGGERLPCLLIGCKGDAAGGPDGGAGASAASAAATALCLPPPCRVSARTGDLDQVFVRLVQAARQPEGHLPDTPARKARRRALRRALLAVGLGATAAAGGYFAYRYYKESPSAAASPSSGGGGKGGGGFGGLRLPAAAAAPAAVSGWFKS